jgi:Domain of unknown function (DUF6456)
MAHRNRTRAARRRAEKQRVKAAARERGEEAAEDAKTRPRNARHAAQLDVLLHRCVITTDQARAGGRFSRDFQMSGSVIGRYEAGMPRPPKKYSAPPPDTPHAIEARERFERAVVALGPLAPIMLHVCICDRLASTWGANGKPNGDAVGLLRYGLAVLDMHYARVRFAMATLAEPTDPPASSYRSSARASAAHPAASAAASGPT